MGIPFNDLRFHIYRHTVTYRSWIERFYEGEMIVVEERERRRREAEKKQQLADRQGIHVSIKGIHLFKNIFLKRTPSGLVPNLAF